MAMPQKPLTAVVTAGGTREAIDDVRVVTNVSSGRFGAAIARALAERGVSTVLLGSREMLARPDEIDARVRASPFVSVADLARELDRLIREGPPDVIFMAAAVSDYTPARVEGKIPSTVEEMTVRFVRTKKILGGLREACGLGTTIVGFKLLSGVPQEELVSAALRQVKRDRLNLTVANDLRDLAKGEHPVLLVTPEGGAIPLRGKRDEVASRLVDVVLERHRVRWSRSAPEGPPVPAAERDPGFGGAASALALAQAAGLLPGTDGNVSHRATGRPGFWTTPRQVDKSSLDADGLLRVEVDLGARAVRYRGDRKPSIDSPVHAWLYDRLAGIEAFLHFHRAIVLPDASTEFPYPCGSIEEAEEVHRVLAAAALEGRYAGGSFAVELVHHGFLVGLERGGVARLAAEWERARAAYERHLRDVAARWAEVEARLEPVLASARVIGVLARFERRGCASAFLLPEERGGGRGDEVVLRLDRRGDTMAVLDACGVLGYYLERGYRVEGRDGPLALLEAPSRRTDLARAASACLFDPIERRVLLGRRLTEPWLGYLAFPGGALEAGEEPIDAAGRELREETGLALPGRRPLLETIVRVGAPPDGVPGYEVVNLSFPVMGTPAPVPSAEMEAAWLPLDDALAARPMAAGTRRVLRRLVPLLRDSRRRSGRDSGTLTARSTSD